MHWRNPTPVVQVPLALATGALVVELIAAALPARHRSDRGSNLALRIVVPAHDEAAGIAATVTNLTEQAPVTVLADNCTDDTAVRARQAGAEVLERIDPARRGKGHALQWGLPRVLAEHPELDGVVIVDADCRATPNLVAALAQALTQAPGAQADDVVANPEQAPLRYAAMRLKNTVRPAGRARLGLSAGLHGTGMALTRASLLETPWQATGLAEDAEHHAALVRAGTRTAWVGHAAVRSEVPLDRQAAQAQQARWEGGLKQLITGQVPALVTSGDARAIATGLELLIPPQSLLAAGNVVCAVLGNRRLGRITLAGHATFVLGGLALTRAPAPVWRALTSSPVLVVQKLVIQARRRPTSWERTAR